MDSIKLISKAKAKQATAEIALKQKIRVCLNLIPADGEDEVSVSSSINSTFNEVSLTSTPRRGQTKSDLSNLTLSSIESGASSLCVGDLDSSLATRRKNHGVQNPQLMMEELRKLSKASDKFNQSNDILLELLEGDSDSFCRALRRREHFYKLTDNLIGVLEMEIWTVCKQQQVVLPSRCPNELAKWKCFNLDRKIEPGFIPPVDHANEDTFSKSSNGSYEEQASVDKIVLAKSSEKAQYCQKQKHLNEELFSTPLMDKVLLGLSEVIKVVNTATIIESEPLKNSSIAVNGNQASQDTQPLKDGSAQLTDFSREAELSKEKRQGTGPPGGGGGDDDDDSDGEDDSERNLKLNKAILDYRSCKQTIVSKVSAVEKSIEKSICLSKDIAEILKLQLNDSKTKLDHKLPVLYKDIQALNPSKLIEYAGDFDQFNSKMIVRIIEAQTELFSKKEKTKLAARHPPH